MTVNVQVPVLDDNFPEAGGHRERLYVPAGVQHMTGAQALEYSRSRKSTSDFERGARQQRVLVSLRRQLDVGQALQNIDVLAAAVGKSVRTDIPRELVPQLLGLADKVDTRSIRSVIFTPPFYQTECMDCPPRGYIIQPKVARIRSAVADAFKIDPAFADTRDALTQEGAELWVLNGSGRTGEAARLSDYLELPRAGRDGADPEARHHRPRRDHDPRLQRRARQVPADRPGADEGLRGPGRADHRRRRPRRLRGHHRRLHAAAHAPARSIVDPGPLRPMRASRISGPGSG